jgi:hypothetical protein
VSGALRLLQVSRASIVRYRSGSATLALTSVLTSSGAYTQPLGSDGFFNPEALSDDVRKLSAIVVGWQNRSGIFVVFEGVDEVTCQRCYVFLTYYCALNGLPLGPSSLLRHLLPSRTDYDSYTSFC